MVEQQHIHESFTLNDTDTQGDYTLGAGVLPPPILHILTGFF
jgi:hypothetical protein